MKKLLLTLFVVLVVGTLALVGCAKAQPAQPPQQTQQATPSQQAAKTLKIGVIFGLTGQGSQNQLIERDAALLCADWINEKGGITIKGEKYQIQPVVADNQMTPPGSIDAATKLVEQEKVGFIIGTIIPVQADAVASVTDKNKVLFAAVRSDIPHADRPYYFVANYSFGAPVPFLYDVLLMKYPGVKKMGYLIGDEPGARAVENISRGVATARGLTLLDTIVHPWEAGDFYPVWTKIMASQPDAVDIGLNLPSGAAACIKQGRELGFKGPIIAATPGDPNLLLSMMGPDAATDFIYASFDPYGSEVPAMVKEIVQRWEARYKNQFNTDGLEAWDAMWVLSQAIEKAQSLDPTDVKNTWEKMDTLNTSTGLAKMGGQKTWGINHMVFNPCPVSRFVSSKLEFIKWYDSYIP